VLQGVHRSSRIVSFRATPHWPVTGQEIKDYVEV